MGQPIPMPATLVAEQLSNGSFSKSLCDRHTGFDVDFSMDASPPSRMSRVNRQGRLTIGRAHEMCVITALALALAAMLSAGVTAEDKVEQQFRERVEPILEDYCLACHGNGLKKGGVTLDEFTPDNGRLRDRKLWWAVLRNVRSGIMPPAGKPRPSEAERRALEDWIKHGALGIDPMNSDPGRVTVRRLNRVEYRNTIRDLIGVDYDTTVEFPPDDAGHGFDNIADVLTLSPMLLEKYLAAAKSIVSQAVPMVSGVVAERKIGGQRFRREGVGINKNDGGINENEKDGPLSFSYYEPASVKNMFHTEQPGRYQLVVHLVAQAKPAVGSDFNRCRVILKADDHELLREEYIQHDEKPFQYQIDVEWAAGKHELDFTLEPLTPGERRLKYLAIRIDSVTVRGPLERQFWVRPANYSRFFPSAVPEGADASSAGLRARSILSCRSRAKRFVGPSAV